MKVLDLFSGLKGWSSAFSDRGHDVLTLDVEPKFEPDITENILDVLPSELPKAEIILASPPCQSFSVATIGRNWNPGYVPANADVVLSVRLVKHALWIIKELDPPLWVMENPRAMLRKLSFMAPYPRTTVTYCQYGETHMKPTDLWGRLPPAFIPRKCYNGAPCHERAPRGSSTGTQGIKGADARGKIPYGLSLEVCVAAEKHLKAPL